MARLEDAITYQGTQRSLFCSHHGCSKSVPEARGVDGHPSPQLSPGGQFPSTTLPATISLDAAIYVAVVVIFYALLIMLLVGTNLHRFRNTRKQRRLIDSEESSASSSPKHLKVSVSCPPEDGCVTVV